MARSAEGPDADGDGLSDEFERLRGTDPARPDTDADGFGDGMELANGSDPLDARSQPLLSVLPAVDFQTSSVLTVSEGDGVCRVPLVLDAPLRGVIHVAVDPSGTAVAVGPRNDIEPVPATIAVDGTAAAIPFRLVDDLRMAGTRYLILDIRPDPPGRYRPARRYTHTPPWVLRRLPPPSDQKSPTSRSGRPSLFQSVTAGLARSALRLGAALRPA